MKLSASHVAGAIIAAVVVADQVTKQLVLSFVDSDERVRIVGSLSIVRRFNTGGAFSLGDGKGAFPWLVSALVVSLVVWFVRGLRRGDPRMSGVSLYALSAMVGGALGNQLDRLFRAPGWNRGAVVDFVSTGFWGIFNLADAALSVGAVVIALLAFRPHKETVRSVEQGSGE